MFRDAIRKLSLRKKLAILASVGVFFPLIILTYMQYRSLAELQNKTKGAFKENLRQGLSIVEHQMKQRLANVAVQTLSPIDSIYLSPSQAAQEIEKYFADVKRSHPEIKEIFAFAYRSDEQEPNSYAYVYSDKFVKVAQAGFTPAQSHILSLFNNSRMAQTFIDDDHKYLFAPDFCLTCPPNSNPRQGAYLFYPLKELTSGEQRGFAGVLLNESFVRDDLIAGSIGKTLNLYHANTAASSDITFTISDENSRVLYSNAAAQNGYFLETNFDPPFSNWKARIGLKNTNLDELARNSFLHSVGA
ncbi:MAG TPA: hypothetical protein VEF04_06480, partial [Blastocatellia bacterium]|nr:hypothetical protein [Blastocatellia bacterium]